MADTTKRAGRVPTGAQADRNSIAADSKAPESPDASQREAPRADENTIRPARDRLLKQRAGGRESEALKYTERSSASQAMPGHITVRYVQVGNRYHFPNGEPAFVDRTRRLSTQLENTEVISDLLAIAKERGWNTIAISGTEKFRKEAWAQANMAGLTVRGYRATDLEQALLARRMGRDRERNDGPDPRGSSGANPPDRASARTAAPDEMGRDPAQRSSPAPDRVRAGILVDHGVAPYQFNPRAEPSYFVRLDTPEGEQVLWGKDLQRAIEKSLSKARPGVEVTVRQLGAKPVTVNRAVRDAAGQVLEEVRVQTHLNRWSVERTDFLQDRAAVADVVRDPSIDAKTAVAKHPELAGTYTELHVAQLVAKEHFTNPEDRQRFVARVRTGLVDEIARGEPLSATRVPARTQARDNPTRTRERAQERVLS